MILPVILGLSGDSWTLGGFLDSRGILGLSGDSWGGCKMVFPYLGRLAILPALPSLEKSDSFNNFKLLSESMRFLIVFLDLLKDSRY